MALALVLVAALPPRARASSWRHLSLKIVAFASDGERYAAWQVAKDAPIVVFDTVSGRRVSYAGCSLVDSGEPSLEPTSAAGRFLVECGNKRAVLNVRTDGVPQLLPSPAGPLDGEWLAVGARYVKGNADPHDCAHSAKEARGERSPCIALYDIATGALSYRRESQVPDLDRPGAPTVCAELRGGLANYLANLPSGEFTYRDGLLAYLVRHGEAPATRIDIEGCHERSQIVSSSPEPRDLLLADGLLSWDTGHEGTADAVDENVGGGRLWTYDVATRRRASVPLPQTSRFGIENARGAFGYSSHAGRTLFWIATRTINSGELRYVETSSVYSKRL